MSRPPTATRTSSGKVSAARPARRTSLAAPASPAPLGEPFLQRKYQELIRQHLDKLLDKLFAEYTGLHIHLSWAPPPPHEWESQALPTGCSVCCRLSGSPQLKVCRICGPRQLARTLRADDDGHHFTCCLGIRNYWLPIRIRDETLGIAYLQALDQTGATLPGRKRLDHAVRHRLRQADARVLSRLKFFRAARLLHLIVQHVQTAGLSDLRKADLTSAGRVVLALEAEQVRLHETLKRHLPVTSLAPRRSGPESHAEQIVHRLLERIELDYRKPITLQQYARELRMNAAYLSALFSHAVGAPFKTYLTDLRMAKAKELLGGPTANASEVADAVGYASENRFRIAFKKATGLPPKLWRETMQTNPAPPSPSI